MKAQIRTLAVSSAFFASCVEMHGLAETLSKDQGKTWTPVQHLPMQHPTSRFFLRRLQSGALLLVKHGGLNEKVKREKLMAFISDDDGKTWQGGLMFDERDDVTYYIPTVCRLPMARSTSYRTTTAHPKASSTWPPSAKKTCALGNKSLTKCVCAN